MEDLRFACLSDNPESASLIAGWYFAEWGHLNSSATVESIREKLIATTHGDAIPMTVLAVLDEAVVGSAQLKYREMQIYPEKEHWLGGVFVVPEHRRKGIAARLVEAVVGSARSLGVEVLHLQTPELDGGLYLKLGWRPAEQLRYKGIDVLVMEREL